MNDEINKIIQSISDFYKLDNALKYYLDRHKAQIILDYISNLQQKVEQYENPDDLTLFYMWLDEKAKDKMKELQKENQDLKRMCELYGQSLYNADLTKYKSRNNKAIEYIENEYQDNIIITDYADNPITPQELYGELLDILKGDNDE